MCKRYKTEYTELCPCDRAGNFGLIEQVIGGFIAYETGTVQKHDRRKEGFRILLLWLLRGLERETKVPVFGSSLRSGSIEEGF